MVSWRQGFGGSDKGTGARARESGPRPEAALWFPLRARRRAGCFLVSTEQEESREKGRRRKRPSSEPSPHLWKLPYDVSRHALPWAALGTKDAWVLPPCLLDGTPVKATSSLTPLPLAAPVSVICGWQEGIQSTSCSGSLPESCLALKHHMERKTLGTETG